jgi:DNA-binding beta-propeller fold protein YncE
VNPRTGEHSHTLTINGLFRDAILSPDGTQIWATDCEFQELMAIDLSTLTVKCRRNLAADNLMTPFAIKRAGDRLYLSNVTYPILAEFRLGSEELMCHMILNRSIDFHRIGYTSFTEGVYGLDVDPTRGTAMVTVGMLEGRYELGLVEVGLDDFAMRREMRLPSGITIFSLPGAHRVLLPSYYQPKIFEVDLDRWKLVRTIHAAPNIFSLAYDEGRRLIYATSRTTGTLQVIDYNSGRVVREDVIGNKAQPLYDDGDRLFIGSEFGIIEIDLKRYLGAPRSR